MKKTSILSILIITGILLTACGNEKKELPKSPQKVDSTKVKVVDNKFKHPKYTITVEQAGKTLGDIEIELFPEIAQKMCRNFDSLVSIKFYDGTAFHRAVPGYIIQGGDPNSKDKPKELWGFGDTLQRRIPAEFSKYMHERGVISSARNMENINSAASQFFICLNTLPDLDKKYTIFGNVIKGIELADVISKVKVEKHPKTGEKTLPVKKVTMKIVKKD